MSDSGKDSFVNKYTGTLPPPEARDLPTSEYKAFGPDLAPKEPIAMIDVRHANGQRRGVPYSYLMEPIYTPDMFIELITTNCRITLEGRSLETVFEALLRHKLGFVQEFNAARFEAPANGEPVITKITRKGLFEGNTDASGRA